MVGWKKVKRVSNVPRNLLILHAIETKRLIAIVLCEMSSIPTRGRANTESQRAAISRVVALSPQRKTILDALDRVVRSPAFESSQRAQGFLRYVVEHALDGELDRLKERVIGSALFGRQPDYDTGTDSIVRVTATEVRKRLETHYERPAHDEPVVFELPTGSYIPEIHLEMVDRRPSRAAEPAPEVKTPEAPPTPSFRWVALAGWAAAIVIGLLWAGSAWLKPSAPKRTLQYLPWTALFKGPLPPHLVLADSGIGNLRYLQWFSLSVPVYANRSYMVPPPGLSPEFRDVWQQVAPKAYTSIVDARLATAYASLAAAAGHEAVLRYARDLQLSDFHGANNLILLGSSSSNPWVQLFQDQLDFQLELERSRRVTVTIRHPKPGDPSSLSTDVSSGTTGVAYASLALVNGLDGRGTVLIAQGTNMEGTDVAGNLAITRPDELAAALRGCGIEPTDPSGRFEVLLRLDATAGSTVKSSILATRCSGGRSATRP